MFGGSKMPYPGMDPSLINFVNTMAPKEGEMPYEGQPIEFRKKMAAKSAKLSLKRPESLAIKEHIFETPLGSVSARIYFPKWIVMITTTLAFQCTNQVHFSMLST